MVLIVQSLWNRELTGSMAKAAAETLQAKKISHQIVEVPGALEIPLAVKWAWSKAQKIQEPLLGAIACGVILKGDTYHFEIVANESARGLMDLSLELRIPIGNAILACYKMEEAVDRCGGKFGNKGIEAAEAVCSMIQLKAKNDF